MGASEARSSRRKWVLTGLAVVAVLVILRLRRPRPSSCTTRSARRRRPAGRTTPGTPRPASRFRRPSRRTRWPSTRCRPRRRSRFPSRDPQIPDAKLAGWWIPGADAQATGRRPRARRPVLPPRVVRAPRGRACSTGRASPSSSWTCATTATPQGDDARFAGGSEEYLDVLGGWDWVRAQGVPAGKIGIAGFSFGSISSIVAGSQEPQVAAVSGPTRRPRRWARASASSWPTSSRTGPGCRRSSSRAPSCGPGSSRTTTSRSSTRSTRSTPTRAGIIAFVHGALDKVLPASMANELHDAAAAAGADHAGRVDRPGRRAHPGDLLRPRRGTSSASSRSSRRRSAPRRRRRSLDSAPWDRPTARPTPADPATRARSAGTSASRCATAWSCPPTCGSPVRRTRRRAAARAVPGHPGDDPVRQGQLAAQRGHRAGRVARGPRVRPVPARRPRHGLLAGCRPRRVHGGRDPGRVRRRGVAGGPAVVHRQRRHVGHQLRRLHGDPGREAAPAPPARHPPDVRHRRPLSRRRPHPRRLRDGQREVPVRGQPAGHERHAAPPAVPRRGLAGGVAGAAGADAALAHGLDPRADRRPVLAARLARPGLRRPRLRGLPGRGLDGRLRRTPPSGSRSAARTPRRSGPSSATGSTPSRTTPTPARTWTGSARWSASSTGT